MKLRQPARWLGIVGLCLSMLSLAACQVHVETAAEHLAAATEVGVVTHATLTSATPAVVAEASPAGPTPTDAPLALYPTPTAQPSQPAPKPTVTPGLVTTRVVTSSAAAPANAPAVAHVAAKTAPTRIVSPPIKLDSTVKETTWQIVKEGSQLFSEWIVPDYVAGWHSNSALPGAVGNTVMSGHHNIRGEVFRHLVDLAEGDPIYLSADDRWFAYRVETSFIVPERDASAEQQAQNALWIAPTTDERLTLVTCWPYTNNTHRLIVIAKPADDLAGSAPK
jgi:sortase A